jgi:hypothetical protein
MEDIIHDNVVRFYNFICCNEVINDKKKLEKVTKMFSF